MSINEYKQKLNQLKNDPNVKFEDYQEELSRFSDVSSELIKDEDRLDFINNMLINIDMNGIKDLNIENTEINKQLFNEITAEEA